MHRDLTSAFSHPEVRARQLAETHLNAPVLDRISLRDHIVAVDIGAFQEERGLHQRLCFNIALELVPMDGSAADDVDKILSYDTLTDAIAAELAFERLNLLETLAERIAARILRAPQAFRIFLKIEKLDRGPGALGVEIMRARSDQPNWDDPADASAPQDMAEPAAILLCLADDLGKEDIDGVLTAVHCHNGPILIKPGFNVAAPVSKDAATQARLNLLAMDQAAWILCAQAQALSTKPAEQAPPLVIDNRTELDWATKAGRLMIWAPSRMALDAGFTSGQAGFSTGLAGFIAAGSGFGTKLAVGCDVIGCERVELPVLSARLAGIAQGKNYG